MPMFFLGGLAMAYVFGALIVAFLLAVGGCPWYGFLYAVPLWPLYMLAHWVRSLRRR